MLDEYQPDGKSARRTEFSLTQPLIVMACAGGGILLSIGLCGAASMIPGGRVASLGTTGIALFVLSVLSLIGAILWLVVAVIANAFRR